MLNWLKGPWRQPKSAAPEADERIIVLERDAQRLRLELEEKTQKVANLRRDLERERAADKARAGTAAAAEIEQLFAASAGPLAHLVTQAHLLEVDGAPVQAKDVISVARRLVRVFQDHGLTLEGGVGQTVPFDPNRHQLLGGGAATPGQHVVTRFVGIVYRGTLLRQAGVEKKAE